MSMDGMPEYKPVQRVRHRFSLADHPKLRPLMERSGVTSFAVTELTGNDENMAYKRAGAATEATFQLAKAALCEVNDQAVGLGDGSVDKFWETAHPKIRTLIVRCYNDVNNPAADELEALLQSRAVVVG